MQQWEERVCLVLGEAGLGIVNLLDPLKAAVQGAYKACSVSHLVVCEGRLWLPEWVD